MVLVTTPDWYVGWLSSALGPPPLPLQPTSLDQAPPDPSVSAVPPTASTFGEAAGQEIGAPLSPEEATNATPALLKSPSYDVSPENSELPQLIETTFAWAAA